VTWAGRGATRSMRVNSATTNWAIASTSLGGQVVREVTPTLDYLVVLNRRGRQLTREEQRVIELNEGGAAIQVLDWRGFRDLLTPTPEEALALSAEEVIHPDDFPGVGTAHLAVESGVADVIGAASHRGHGAGQKLLTLLRLDRANAIEIADAFDVEVEIRRLTCCLGLLGHDGLLFT